MSRWEGFEELVNVVKAGSFSGAARAMGVSKAYISQHISLLEERLGTRLLNRTTRKLSLTELGTLYYQRCCQVVDELDEIESAVVEFQQQPTGLLKISSPNLLGGMHIVPAISDFINLYPSLDIELNFYSREVDLVEGRYDIAIEVGKRKNMNVVHRTLSNTTFRLVASPGFLNKHGVPGRPEDLKHLHCIQFSEDGQTKSWKLSNGAEDVFVRGQCSWQSNSGICLLSAVRKGMGIAYLPDYYLAEDLKNKTLIPILEDWEGIKRDIVAIYQHRRHPTAKVKLFVDFLEKRFKEQRCW